MAEFPTHMRKVEADIVNKLLTRILSHKDLLIRVYDGVEWATDWTRNRAEVQRETAATDETRYCIIRIAENGAATRIGSILLIHGNDEDVISDASWNPKLEDAESLIEDLMKI
ncbi:MAG: hypothetical protein IE937_09735 [Gammaproteobacteria bacterium]|nr:hypothetical protein [Gammaproteobacteria bacterium]